MKFFFSSVCLTGILVCLNAFPLIAQSPDWSVHAPDFLHAAHITAFVEVDGVVDHNPNNKIGLMVDEEIRGVSTAVTINNQAYHFITAFSNEAFGKSMTLLVYLADQDQIYTATEPYVFVQSRQSGTIETPYLVKIDTDNNFPINFQDIPDQLTRHPFSFPSIVLTDYLIRQDEDPINWSFEPNNQLSVSINNNVLTATPADPEWTGTTSLVITATESNDPFYSATTTINFTIEGAFEVPQWSAIPDQVINRGETFNTINLPDYEEAYTGNCLSFSVVPVLETPVNADDPPTWVVRPQDFQYSMALTTKVKFSEYHYFEEQDNVLGAFVDGELRGVAQPILIDNGEVLYFLSISGNRNGDLVQLKFYHTAHQKMYDVSGQLPFRAFTQVGRPEVPNELDVSPLAVTISPTGELITTIRDESWSGSQTFQFAAFDCNFPETTLDYTSLTYTIDACERDNIVLDFDGQDDYVETGNVLTSSYTKELRINMDVTNSQLNNHFISGASDGGQHVFWATGNAVVDRRVAAGHNGDYAIVQDPSPVQSGWQHYALTYDATTLEMKLYHNGILVDEATNVPNYAGGNAVLLGAFDAQSDLYRGQMDEVRIWNYARTAAEIAADKNIKLSGSENGLIVYYDFNQGIPDNDNPGLTTLLDRTANGNDGTLVNFALAGSTSNWTTPFFEASLLASTPSCPGADISFTATAAGAISYTFFLDANQDGRVDAGELLQSGASNLYISNSLNEGDVVSVRATNVLGCTATAIATARVNVNGGVNNYTVPPGVTELTIEAVGAPGAHANSAIRGGTGGTVTATFNVNPGDVLRFIVGERGLRTGSGGGGGGGSTAVINCGNSGGNCENGVLLMVAGGGGGGGINTGAGLGATTEAGAGGGGFWRLGNGGGGGGVNGAGGGGAGIAGGAAGSFNPIFTSLRGEGFSGGGQGTPIGGGGGGGGGYTGGVGGRGGSYPAYGGTNYVAETAISVINLPGADGAAPPGVGNGSVCILNENSGLAISLSADAATCPDGDVTYTVTADGATQITFFLDENQNGAVDPGESLQSGNGNANTYVSNVLIPGQKLSVVASNGTLSGRAVVAAPAPDDTQDPVFSACLPAYSGVLNLCDEYVPTADKLGITATDNCGDVTITFSPALITSAGITSVTATATDEVGNTTTCIFDLTLSSNPNKYTLTAVDDQFQGQQFQSVSFTVAELLSNDEVSNGAERALEGVRLVDESQGTLTQLDAVTYSFTPAPDFFGNATLEYTLKLNSDAVFFESTAHFYEYVYTGSAITWTEARDLAAAKSLNGLMGYLVTITSEAENDFVRNIIERNSWIGASDFATEGDWRWVTGPEGEANEGQGTPFWLGGVNGNPVDGAYHDWSFDPGGQQTAPHNGNYARISKTIPTGATGSWDDLPDFPVNRAYVVEYGGAEFCTPNLTSTANIIIDVQPDINTGAFITTWKTTTQDPGITIYTNPGLPYDYTIDWGDGTTDNNVTGDISHTYTDHSNLHTVRIAGIFPHFQADNLNVDPRNAHQITSIEQWGNIQWQSMDFMFNNCLNMVYNAIDVPDLSNVTVTRRMFVNALRLNENTDLSGWDMSNVRDMSYMFLNANRFNGDITTWDVSSVTTMEGAFTQAVRFNRDIGGWNVSNVRNMSGVFNGAAGFNQDIGNWVMSSVTDMNGMFIKATAFNQDISGWNVGNVLFMQGTFERATSFNQDISTWNVSKVRNMIGLFAGARSFDQNLGAWNITGLQGGLTLWRAFTGTAMSTANYDATLIGWAAQNVANFVRVGVHGLQYCAGREARQSLIEDHNWRFYGDALDETACGDLPFITTWTTTAEDPAITIYAPQSTFYNYDYTVDWGDGNIDHNVTGDMSYTYSSHDMPHTVKISGEFPGFIAAGSSRRDYENAKQLNSIEQWGSIKWERLYFAFSNAENMVYNATDAPDLSEIGSLGLRGLFWNAKRLASPDLNDWDVSKVTDMSNMFGKTKQFNGAVDRWDLANVKTLLYMFYQATAFNQDISSWDVSNVTDMTGTFSGATSFNQPLDSWDVSKVTRMSNMFSTATNFNQPLNSWDVSKVTWARSMFYLAESFNQNLGSWKLNGLTEGWEMLSLSGMSTTNYDNTLIGWAAQNNIAGSVRIGVNGLQYCAGRAARQALIDDHNWQFIGDALDEEACSNLPFITSWTTTVDDPTITIYAPLYTYDYTVDWGDGNIDENVTDDISHTYSDHSTPHTVTISGTFPSFRASRNAFDLSNAVQLKSIEQWGSIKWKNLASAFQGARNMVYHATDAPDLSELANPSLSNMFNGAESMGSSDLNHWDVSQIVSTSGMFWDAKNFNGAIGNWNVSQVTNMSSMFYLATDFNQPLDTWNVSQVTNMSGMFNGATSFNQPLDSWNVSQVTTMNGMFNNATSFNQPLDSWNVSNVIDMSYMLYGTTNFDQPLDSWEVSQVTDMSSMFTSATNFDQPLDSWEVSQVTDMSYMFNGATNFDQPLDSWDVSQVTNMRYMFYNTTSFNQLLGSWELNALTNAENMLDFSALNKTNYDNTLIGWAANPAIASNITIGVQGLKYCSGENARTDLETNKGWSFVGDIRECPTFLLAADNEISFNDLKAPDAEVPTQAFAIYPNPAANLVNITIKKARSNSVLLIRDQLGRVLWKQTVNDDQTDLLFSLDIAQFQSGMYWVSYQAEKEVLTEKLIIAK